MSAAGFVGFGQRGERQGQRGSYPPVCGLRIRPCHLCQAAATRWSRCAAAELCRGGSLVHRSPEGGDQGGGRPAESHAHGGRPLAGQPAGLYYVVNQPHYGSSYMLDWLELKSSWWPLCALVSCSWAHAESTWLQQLS